MGVNSRDNNFTANKLDDRIAWLNQHTDEYLRQLAEVDETDGLEEQPGQSGGKTGIYLMERRYDRSLWYP